ncbi:MAG: potassium channel family protein [Vicinamibacterales bacterium]
MGALLLILSTSLHGLGMYLVHERFDRYWAQVERRRIRRQLFFSGLIFLMLLTHLAEVLLWAFTLRAVGAISGFRNAFYYAAVTYTTLGYSAEMLPSDWRIVAPMIAMSGLFAFGWTTGVLVNLVRRMHERDRQRLSGSDRMRP